MEKYKNCKIVNIVWIERGILITIIFYILKKYIILLNKIIIINNKEYCKFLKIIFPELKFSIFRKHTNYNFYFNIRKIIKNQDIIIDYLANYHKIIFTNKITLLPWYDINNPIIVYRFNSKYEIKTKKYKIFINKFSKCNRVNYYNNMWDISVLKKYIKFNKKINIYNFLNLINNFLKTIYTNTVEKSKIYYTNRNILYPIQYNINAVKNMKQAVNINALTGVDVDVDAVAASVMNPSQIQLGQMRTEQIQPIQIQPEPKQKHQTQFNQIMNRYKKLLEYKDIDNLDENVLKNMEQTVDVDVNFDENVLKNMEQTFDAKFDTGNVGAVCKTLKYQIEEKNIIYTFLVNELINKLKIYNINIKDYINIKMKAISEYIILLELINKDQNSEIIIRIKNLKNEHKIMKEIYNRLLIL